MPGIYRNGVLFVGTPSDESVFANYVTKTEFATDYGNVDNTSDSVKSVAYATSAGDASTVNNHTIAADVPASAAFTDTTYTLTQDQSDGHILYFTEANGTPVTITIPDNNTTYSDLSDFTNDCGFITNAVNDLTNYYTKSSTYSKTEVNQLISTVPHFAIAVVPDLNIQSPSTSTIYLVPNSGTGANVYDEYVYVYNTSTSTGTFEKLGTQSIDLTQYYTKTQTDTLLAGKADNINFVSGNNTLQLKSGNTILSSVTIAGGSTVIRLADVTGATATMTRDTISLTWTDPDDIAISGVTLAEWAGTKVVRKAGSAPQDSTDGTLVVNSTVHNAYSSTGYADTGLTFGTTYYYRFFPYTTDNIETNGSSVSAIPTRDTISTVPSQSGTLTYDGTSQTATFANYDSTKMSVTGNSATNAGTHTATFTPLYGYQWSDTTTTGKDVSWTIDKATGGATLSSNSVVVDPEHLTATVTISNPTGTIGTPTTSDATVATVSLSGSTLTISSVNDTSGDATISIPIAASSNYNAATVTVSVSAEFLKIVTWAGGTDQEICDMVAAADAGQIDLTEYWSVGNERTVLLNAMSASGTNDYGSWSVSEPYEQQNVTMVLMGKNCYTLKTAVKNTDGTNRTTCSFCVGVKNGIVVLYNWQYGGHMNNSNFNSGSWNSCARRFWCNACYRAALPSTLLPIFKQFEVKTATEYNASTVTISDDWFALFAEKEIFGSRIYSNVTEADALTAIEYYTTASNRVKTKDGANPGGWWERSPYSGASTSFCTVTGDGNADYFSANYPFPFAPFGCI